MAVTVLFCVTTLVLSTLAKGKITNLMYSNKNGFQKKIALASEYFTNGNFLYSELLLVEVLREDEFNSKANELLAYIRSKQGNFNEAHKFLTKSCQDNRCSPESLYYLGVSHLKRQEFESSLIYLQLALDKAGDFFEGLYDLGIAQTNLGLKSEAIASFKKALFFNIKHHLIYLNIGKIQAEIGNTIESLESFDKAICANSEFAEAWFNKGIVLSDNKLFDQAINHFNSAIQYKCEYVDAWVNKGVTLNALEQHDAALVCFEKAIQLRPDYAKAWLELGVALHELQKFDEAISKFEKALELNPRYSDAWMNKGVALNELKEFNAALLCIETAIELKPQHAESWSNKGLILHNLRKYELAVKSYDQALKINPDYADAWSNKGVTLNDTKQYEAALFHFGNAIRLKPEYAEAHHNSAHTYFNLANFDRGWKEYEWRWRTKKMHKFCNNTTKPLWNGESKPIRLFVWAEQGVGDQILYSSVLKELNLLSPKVIVSLENKLIPLFQRSFPDFQFIDKNIGLTDNEYDEHIPIGTIAGFFRKTFFDFSKASFPYLMADKYKANSYKNKLISNGIKVCGLSWKSLNLDIGNDKSIPLQEFIPILKLSGFTFINIQYDIPNLFTARNSETENMGIKSIDNIDIYNDIDATASLIQACDIIVTCSNTTAHIAGALNKLTVLILPYASGKFWYWQDESGKSIWYPSIKVFHQSLPDNWEAPINEVTNYLRGLT